FGAPEFSNIYRNMERIYLVALAKDTENPLGPRSDEVGKKKESEKKEEEKKAPGPSASPSRARPGSATPATAAASPSPKPAAATRVDVDGLRDRIVGLEITPGEYTAIRVVEGKIFYMRRTAGDELTDPDDAPPGARSRTSASTTWRSAKRRSSAT
ncbi:MAG TPA: hypothetical protein VF846_02255, partial [Thermoanaerobaculia bacterium]